MAPERVEFSGMNSANRRRGKREKERARRQRRAEARAAQRHHVAQTAARPEAQSSPSDPVCGVEPVRIDPALRWYIARTLPRFGERALKALHEAKVDTFQPRTSEVVVRRGRRVVRSAQLMLRTVFFGVRDDIHLAKAHGAPGLAEIVCHPEAEPESAPRGNVTGLVLRPARLDPEALQEFADAVAKGEIVAPMGVSEGASVVVLTGPFASFPAVVEKILPGDRLKVGVSIFGRSTPIELGLGDVRLV